MDVNFPSTSTITRRFAPHRILPSLILIEEKQVYFVQILLTCLQTFPIFSELQRTLSVSPSEESKLKSQREHQVAQNKLCALSPFEPIHLQKDLQHEIAEGKKQIYVQQARNLVPVLRVRTPMAWKPKLNCRDLACNLSAFQ